MKSSVAWRGSIGTSRLQPLFGYAGTGITKVSFVGEGADERLQMRGKETGFFYDLRTGEVIETWDNPFTGETVEVFPFLNDKIGGELTLELTTVPSAPAPAEPCEPRFCLREPLLRAVAERRGLLLLSA